MHKQTYLSFNFFHNVSHVLDMLLPLVLVFEQICAHNGCHLKYISKEENNIKLDYPIKSLEQGKEKEMFLFIHTVDKVTFG